MFKKLISTLFLLLFAPVKGWEKVGKIRDNHDDYINNFLFPIFGLVSITTFVGAMWIYGEGDVEYALKITISVVAALFGGFYVASFLLNELFPKYGVIKDKLIAQQFVGYSSVVIYTLYLVMPLLRGFNVLWFISLASVGLIYTGANNFLNIEKSKSLTFTIVAFLILSISIMLLNYLLQLAVI